MNQLAHKTIEKLFKQKNPNGSIWKDKAKDKYNICFTSGGKCYTYKVDNHKDLVNKLKLDIKFIYQYEYDSYIKQITEAQEQIKQGYYIDNTGFFSDTTTVITYTLNDIKNKKINIAAWQGKLENAITV